MNVKYPYLARSLRKWIINDNKVESNENKNPKKKKKKKSSFINLKIIRITNSGKSHKNEKQ